MAFRAPRRSSGNRAPRTHTWFPVMWHCMFVLLVGIGAANAIGADVGGPRIAAIVMLSTAVLLWYAAPLAPGSPWRGQLNISGWLLGAGLLTLALIAFSTDFVWLIFPIAFQIFYRLDVWIATAASLVLTGSGIAVFAMFEGLDLAAALGPVIGVTTAGITAVGYRTVRSESEGRAHLIAELTAEQQRTAKAERTAGIAEERARLGREIHDTLAQGMSSTLLLVEIAGNDLEADPPQARAHLEQAAETLRDNMEEARRFVRDLSPPTLAGASLHDALRAQATQLRAGTSASVEFTIVGEPYPLDAAHNVALFRVAQEAMTNVRRHAAASTVHLTLSYLDAAVTLDVVDDGVGMDPQVQPEGYGLHGMRERTEQLGGHVEIECGPDSGAAIAVWLPSTDREHNA